MNDFKSIKNKASLRAQFSLRTLLVLTAIAAALTPFVVHWMKADRIQVKSSSLEAVTYNHFSGTLDVEFKNGTTYRYLDVPRQKYRGLMDAKSHGSYFHQEIREADFEFEKIE